MKLIFLDIDGVLNDHVPHPNGVCGIKPSCVAEMNRILEAVPAAMIVVSSAWRYYIHNDFMTFEGFNLLLQSHGLACHQRIHGVTKPDAETFRAEDHQAPYDVDLWRERGLRWRVKQILEFWAQEDYPPYVVIDDLPLAINNLVQTDRNVGLTADLADEVIRRLQ